MLSTTSKRLRTVVTCGNGIIYSICAKHVTTQKQRENATNVSVVRRIMGLVHFQIFKMTLLRPILISTLLRPILISTLLRPILISTLLRPIFDLLVTPIYCAQSNCALLNGTLSNCTLSNCTLLKTTRSQANEPPPLYVNYRF